MSGPLLVVFDLLVELVLSFLERLLPLQIVELLQSLFCHVDLFLLVEVYLI